MKKTSSTKKVAQIQELRPASVIETVRRDAEAITEVEIERIKSVLEEVREGEEVLGVLGEKAYRYFALNMEYRRQADLAQHAASFDITDPSGKLEMQGKATRFSVLASLAGEIGWTEARDGAGERAWGVHRLSLRKGFTMVSQKEEEAETEGEGEGEEGGEGVRTEAFIIPFPPGASGIFRAAVGRMLSQRQRQRQGQEPETATEPETEAEAAATAKKRNLQ